MAIDFSQVKTITIPEGSVTKITDSTGNILWQSASWHTIWEGNVTLSNSTANRGVATLKALSGTVKLRVTWSCSASGGGDYGMSTWYYNNTNGWQDTKPDNPFQFDLDTASNRDYIVGCARVDNYSRYGRRCYLSWYHAIKTFGLNGSVGEYGDGGANVSVTITKIEQYS